ncbi:MAG: hypothetical protein LBE34_01540 [Flavobacteriaceae bacterium]|jgi:predicted branched-subunit amino acid permease|nr:hypothetical protein [Flavobacteriaceae bacterium]
MSPQIKTIGLQFVSFAVFFVLARIAFTSFTDLSGFWLPAVSAVVATILAPQFKVFRTEKGDKVCVSWLFFKGVKVLN